MPKAKIKRNKSSYLDGKNIRAYDLQDETVRKDLFAARKNIYHRVNQAYQELVPNILLPPAMYKSKDAVAIEEAQTSVKVHYDPLVFPDRNDVVKSLYTAESDNALSDYNLRKLSKHRCVTSQVNLYANGFGEINNTPTHLTLTTGVAPNFSHADEKGELKQFTNPDGSFMAGAYQDVMKLSFKRWLSAQDNSGVNVVVMPFIGGGIFLNCLDDQQKALAQKHIVIALKQALQEEGVAYKNIKEVVFALPDNDKSRKISSDDAYQLLQDYSGSPSVTVANVDIFEAVNALSQPDANGQQLSVGLINPGNDCVIGGGYKAALDHEKTGLEEVICHLTDAVYIQSEQFNEKNIGQKMVQHFSAFDEAHQFGYTQKPTLSLTPGRTDTKITFMDESKFQAIEKLCKQEGWTVTKDAGGQSANVRKDTDSTKHFDFDANKITTPVVDKDTFKMMIKVFQESHKNKTMIMVAGTDAIKKMVEEVCKELELPATAYSISVKGEKPAPTPTPTPTPKEPESSAVPKPR